MKMTHIDMIIFLIGIMALILHPITGHPIFITILAGSHGYSYGRLYAETK